MAWLYVEYWLTVPDLEDVKISNELQIENIFPRVTVGELFHHWFLNHLRFGKDETFELF